MVPMPRTAKSSPHERHNVTPINVTIPPSDCDVARRLANAKKVSGVWIVRDAVKKYIQANSPIVCQEEHPMKSDLVLTLIRHPLVEDDHMDCMVALAGERFYSATFRKN
jgi:hypothetical protein